MATTKKTTDPETKPVRKRGRPRKVVENAPVTKPSGFIEVESASQLVLFEDSGLDLSVFKDDMSTMEHPFFSVSKKPDFTTFRYEKGNVIVEVQPSAEGRPTINDKDFIIYLQSLYARNRFENPDDILRYRRIEVSLSEFAHSVHREPSSSMAVSFEKMLDRLKGSTIKTNVRSQDESEEIHGFSFLDDYKILRRSKNKGGGILKAEVTISDWCARQIRDNNILTIDSEYFSLKKPIEKRLYEIVRKHCGMQVMWIITLPTLKDKMGISKDRELRFFRAAIKEVVKRNPLPNYNIAFDKENDALVAYDKDIDRVNEFLIDRRRLDWFMSLQRAEEKDDIDNEPTLFD